jgi:hypothetical protein
MNAKDFKLDYFQFYELGEPKDLGDLSPLITLQGQFDEDHPEWARPRLLRRFANPVSKNGEPIFDKNAHLTWYRIKSSDRRARRSVTVANQFWKKGQELVIDDVVAMLAPAQKRIPRGEFTKLAKLGHYKVYRVINEQQVDSQPVKLADQFQEREAEVYRAVAFAVPVTKQLHGKEFPIQNPKAHLTIFSVQHSDDMPNVIDARDQFGTHRSLKMDVSYLLAVPSKKIDWKEVD